MSISNKVQYSKVKNVNKNSRKANEFIINIDASDSSIVYKIK